MTDIAVRPAMRSAMVQAASGSGMARPDTEELWVSDYVSFTGGAELLTGVGTDFFDSKDAPWTWDAANTEYDVDGSQGGNVDMTENTVMTVGNNYVLVYEVDNYAAGNFRQLAGTATGANRTADGKYSDWLTAAGNGNYLVRADVNGSGSTEGFSVKQITSGAVDFGAMWTYYDSYSGVDSTGFYLVNGPSSSQMGLLNFRAANTLSADLKIGTRYAFSFEHQVTNPATANIDVRIYDGSSTVIYSNIPASLGVWETFSETFIARHATNAYFRIEGGGASQLVYIQNFSLIG